MNEADFRDHSIRLIRWDLMAKGIGAIITVLSLLFAVMSWRYARQTDHETSLHAEFARKAERVAVILQNLASKDHAIKLGGVLELGVIGRSIEAMDIRSELKQPTLAMIVRVLRAQLESPLTPSFLQREFSGCQDAGPEGELLVRVEILRQLVSLSTIRAADPAKPSPTDGLWLDCLPLSGIDLRGFIGRNVKLRGTDLTRAELSNADLSFAWVDGTRFLEANLNDAQLSGVRGVSPDFSLAQLNRTVLSDAVIPGAVFRDAKGIDTVLSNVDARKGDFAPLMLDTPTIYSLRLTGATLRASCLSAPKGYPLIVGRDQEDAARRMAVQSDGLSILFELSPPPPRPGARIN